MKILLSSVVGLALVPSFLFGHHGLSRSGVERALLHQMNSSAAGRITISVRCERTTVPGNAGTTAYRCVLTSVRGTRAHVTVLVNGDSWRALWAPLAA